jgi:hypothetical protein
MSASTTETPKCIKRDFVAIAHSNIHWRHVIPPDIDWRAPLATDYWRDMLMRLTPGDRIDVATQDFDIYYQLLVKEVVDIAGFLRMSARPLFPHDLGLPPITQIGDRPRYAPRPDRDGGGLYEVRDVVSGDVIKNQMDRRTANDLAVARNEAAAQATAEAAEPARRARR